MDAGAAAVRQVPAWPYGRLHAGAREWNGDLGTQVSTKCLPAPTRQSSDPQRTPTPYGARKVSSLESRVCIRCRHHIVETATPHLSLLLLRHPLSGWREPEIGSGPAAHQDSILCVRRSGRAVEEEPFTTRLTALKGDSDDELDTCIRG